MKFAIGCLVLCASVALVFSFKCGHGGDPTACYAHLTCNMDGEMIGCEHDTCTCLPAPPTTAPPMNCTVKEDCAMGGMVCFKHHNEQYDASCLNNECVCLEHPPHPH